MIKLPFALSLALIASAARADAFSELRRFAGPAPADLVKVVPPVPVLVAPEPPARRPAPIRVTSTQWNDAFPVARKAVLAAGAKVGTKEFAKWSCEYQPGAAAARCDFAYDVWPEMCWYGFDHVVADIDLKDAAKATVVSREWRAD